MPKSSKLTKAVESAKSKNIVIVASKGDQGNNQKSVYPADYDEVKRTVSNFFRAGVLASQHGPSSGMRI